MPKILHLLLTLFCLLPSAGIHADTLSKLKQDCGEALDKFDYKQLGELSAQYIDAAIDAGDKYGEGYAMFYSGVSALFSDSIEKAQSYLNSARILGTELAADSLLALSHNSIGIYEATANNNSYLAQWHFTESLKYAKRCNYLKLEGSIYGNLCTIAQMQKDTTVMDFARECYQFGLHNDNPHVEFLGVLHMGEIFYLKENYDSAQYYTRRAIDICQQNELRDIAIAYVSLSNILHRQSLYDEADKYTQLAIRSAEENGNQMVLANAYEQKANLCRNRGQYAESNSWLDKELGCGVAIEHVKPKIYELKARNFKDMGRGSEALEFMTLSKELSDQNSMSELEHTRREREMLFNIIEQERQLEQNNQDLQTRNMQVVFLVVLLLLSLLLFGVLIHHFRNRSMLYKKIIIQNRHAIERENELNQKLRDMGDKETGTSKRISDDKAQQVYDELCRLMEEEKIYTKPNVTREEIIERLGTNRTYLSEIIKEKANGMNYAQFVNSFRIRDAVRILSDATQINYPIKQICMDLGFSSVSTFHKLFKDATGIPPDAYRRSLQSL